MRKKGGEKEEKKKQREKRGNEPRWILHRDTGRPCVASRSHFPRRGVEKSPREPRDRSVKRARYFYEIMRSRNFRAGGNQRGTARDELPSRIRIRVGKRNFSHLTPIN